jgi:hypothetical protein
MRRLDIKSHLSCESRQRSCKKTVGHLARPAKLKPSPRGGRHPGGDPTSSQVHGNNVINNLELKIKNQRWWRRTHKKAPF